MAEEELWEAVRALIRAHEFLAAIEIMEKWLKGRLNDGNRRRLRSWLDELIAHSGRINSVLNNVRRGRISKEDERIELNEISFNLLALVDILEAQDHATVEAPPMGVLPARYSEGRFEKIMGDKSRLQMVSWLERGLECSTAVCRLVSAAIRGTGFRVLGDCLVTNNHVIPSADQATRFAAEFFFEERLDGSLKDPAAVGLDPERFWTSEQLDITVVGAQFAGNALANQVLPLSLESTRRSEVGDPVCIIQHPLGGPKQIALSYNHIINIFEHRLQYVTDTLPGSSGAPVFNARWEVIAVHHAGGSLLKNESGEHVFANEGINASAFSSVPAIVNLMGAR